MDKDMFTKLPGYPEIKIAVWFSAAYFSLTFSTSLPL